MERNSFVEISLRPAFPENVHNNKIERGYFSGKNSTILVQFCDDVCRRNLPNNSSRDYFEIYANM